MELFRKALLGTAIATMAVTAGVSVAHADPITLYYSFDGTTYNTLPGTNTTNTGLNSTPMGGTTVTNSANGQSFGVQFSATGSGSSLFSLPEPSFDTQSISVSSNTGGLLYLVAIETGLTNMNITGFNIGYTNNQSTVSVGERFLVGQNLSPATMSSSSVTVAPLTTQQAFVAATGLTSGYSIGERYRVDFGSTAGNINATISARGVSVPEPASMALLGAGLVGVGVFRRRRAK